MQSVELVSNVFDLQERRHELSRAVRLWAEWGGPANVLQNRSTAPPRPLGRKMTATMRKTPNSRACTSPSRLKKFGNAVTNTAPSTGPAMVRAPPRTAINRKLIALSTPKLSTLTNDT